MADNGTAPEQAAAAAAGQQPLQIKQRILAQYIRDMSFENAMVQGGLAGEVQPEIQVQVNLDAKKRGGDNRYEVVIKLNVTSKNKSDEKSLFLLEIEYAGLFEIEGLNEQQMHPYLLIECPRMLFPYLRRIVADITHDGGFPPLNLEQIDFVALYRNELAKRVQAQGDAAPKADA